MKLKTVFILMLVNIFTFSNYSHVKASDVSVKQAFETASEHLGERANANEDWKGLKIGKSEALYNTSNEITSFIFELTGHSNGYIIVKRFDDKFFVVEGSPVTESPYAKTRVSDQKVYLGPLNYFVENQSGELFNLDDGQEYNKNSIVDTMPNAPISTKVDNSILNSTGNDTFLSYVTKTSGFPSIPQSVVDWHHCTPTAAANITRYRYRYYGLSYDNAKYIDWQGYPDLIRSIGVFMRTGTNGQITGTLGTDVAQPFEDWIAQNTDKTAVVEEYFRSNGSAEVSWSKYTTYIRNNVPVLVTVGKSAYPDMGSTYHTVTGFGFYTKTDGTTMMVSADPQTGGFKEIIYITPNQSHIYAIYPVFF